MAKILIVEDESIVAKDIQNVLKNHGYPEPVIARSGEDAVRIASEILPDLVLMDIMLAGELDGIGAASAIKSKLDLPIIYLTANADEETLQRAKITEPFGYILKPFEVRELYTNIEISLYKHKIEKELKESEERYALAAAGSNDGLWDWNLTSGKIYFSPRWKSMLGYRENEFESTVDNWFRLVHPEDLPKLKESITDHREGSTSQLEFEYRIRHNDGSYIWVFTRGLALKNEKGEAYRMAGSQTDVNIRRNAEEQLLHYTFHDPLTDLPNRILFIENLSHEIRNCQENPSEIFALLYLEIEGFDDLNRKTGFPEGNKLVLETATILKKFLGRTDIAGRLGSNSFGMLMHSMRSEKEISELIEKIQLELAKNRSINGNEIHHSLRAGGHVCRDAETDPEVLLRKAELEMIGLITPAKN